MTTSYNLENVRTLLTKGFSDLELRRLCFDGPDFRPVYDELATGTGKAEIIDKLLEYADRQELLGALLTKAQAHNPDQYEKHQPYEGAPQSGDVPEKSQGAKTPAGKQAPGKFHIEAPHSQIGVIGDQTKITGGIHFGDTESQE